MKTIIYIICSVILVSSMIIYLQNNPVSEKYTYYSWDREREYPILNLNDGIHKEFENTKSFKEICRLYNISDEELADISYMYFEYYDNDTVGQDNSSPDNFVFINCFDKNIIKECINRLDMLNFELAPYYVVPSPRELYDYNSSMGGSIDEYFDFIGTDEEEYNSKGGFVRFYIPYDKADKRREAYNDDSLPDAAFGACIDVSPYGMTIYNFPYERNLHDIFGSPDDYHKTVEEFEDMYNFLSDNLSADCYESGDGGRQLRIVLETDRADNDTRDS